jgi:hypothetical protein
MEIGKEKVEVLMGEIKRILVVAYAAGNRKLMRKKGTY